MATDLAHNIQSILAVSGAEVLTDPASLDFFAHDIFDRGADLAAVIRPRDRAQLVAAVRVAAENQLALIPRGGGMSYTGGYTADHAGAVLIDFGTMDRILAINADDMTVTVEPGCTWAKLYDVLKPLGLRTAFWGTLSGIKATVGGGMSQNCLFWGSGRHGTGAQSCIALEIVLADGSVLRTGSNFARPFGPDLTGLFLADTGAMGIKASITLRLVQEARAHGYASFVFDSHADVLAAMADIGRADIATECFGFDPRLNAIRMRRDSLGSDAKALVSMMKAQGSVLGALREGAKVVAAGRSFIDEAKFSLHILAERRNQPAADADIAEARDLARKNRGREVDNSIPKIVRANPFGPLNSMVGPAGERWAPIHGLLPHSRSVACYGAIEALFAAHREAMERHGMHCGTLISGVANGAVLIEPCLYWPDARNPLIDASVEPGHLAKLPDHAHDGATWALVTRIKQALIDLFHDHGATHLQIGRAYRYADSLDPAALRLVRSVKATVDPDNRMNPGSLGIV